MTNCVAAGRLWVQAPVFLEGMGLRMGLTNEVLVGATDPSFVRRDRLLAALLDADPAMCLLQHGPSYSFLVTTTEPPQIFLVPTRDRDVHERLPVLLLQIAESFGRGPVPTHFVAVGGGPDVAYALRQMSLGQGGTFGFHHIDDASRYTFVKGPKLPVLERAASVIRSTEPPTAERILGALEKGRVLALRDQKAVARIRGPGKTPVTLAILGVCVLVFAFAWFFGQRAGGYEGIVQLGAVNGPLVRRGEYFRLVSSMFLHGGLVHLGMNMLALQSLGFMLEPVLGSRRFLILYGLSGLAGAVATTLGGNARFSVGASGAIWGLMTALLGIVLFPRGLLPPLLLSRLKTGAWRPVLLNVGLSFLPGIDLLAHFGGGIMGFLLGAFVLGRGLVPMDERKAGQGAEPGGSLGATLFAAIMAIGFVGSLGWAAVAQEPWALGDPPKMVRTSVGDTGLSVELPAPISDKVIKEAGEGATGAVTKYVFGEVQHSLMTFDVIVERLSEERSADEIKTLLEEEKKRVNEEAPYSNAKRVGEARIVKVGPHDAVVVDHVAEGVVKMRTYVLVVGARLVLVRGYAGNDRAEGWKGMEEKVAGSLQER